MVVRPSDVTPGPPVKTFRALVRNYSNAALIFHLSICIRSPLKKSPVAKSLLFDTDTQKENNTESQSSDSPVPSSLLHLIGQVAETAEDKYRLLEQRDKILRQGQTSSSSCLQSSFIVMGIKHK